MICQIFISCELPESQQKLHGGMWHYKADARVLLKLTFIIKVHFILMRKLSCVHHLLHMFRMWTH